MTGVRYITDLDECRGLWQGLMPRDNLTDLWAVRASFHDAFKRSPLFLVHETDGRPDGLLPLSYVAEHGCYAYFPGETWHGLTWLEQNRLVAANRDVVMRLIDAVPAECDLRYLNAESSLAGQAETDEIGYLFHPEECDRSLDNHLAKLPAKRRSQYKKTFQSFIEHGYELRINHKPDLGWMISMNLAMFEEQSYFRDRRFRAGFRRMAQWLGASGLIRVVTVLIDGQIAAIDCGAIYNGTYTVLAGGVNRQFPGVAKLINLLHLSYACDQDIREVDFLCGDFGWKDKLHLKPRPLYRIIAQPAPGLLSAATA